ncbi:MAG: hypothetical protein ABI843_07545 [Dokdonella sp.]
MSKTVLITGAGFNETMGDTAFRWLDDSKNFTKRADLRATLDNLLSSPQGLLDPQEMIDRMIDIVPKDSGKYRNVVPQFVEDLLKKAQIDTWSKTIWRGVPRSEIVRPPRKQRRCRRSLRSPAPQGARSVPVDPVNRNIGGVGSCSAGCRARPAEVDAFPGD